MSVQSQYHKKIMYMLPNFLSSNKLKQNEDFMFHEDLVKHVSKTILTWYLQIQIFLLPIPWFHFRQVFHFFLHFRIYWLLFSFPRFFKPFRASVYLFLISMLNHHKMLHISFLYCFIFSTFLKFALFYSSFLHGIFISLLFL